MSMSSKHVYRIESLDSMLGQLLPGSNRKSLFANYSLAVAMEI